MNDLAPATAAPPTRPSFRADSAEFFARFQAVSGAGLSNAAANLILAGWFLMSAFPSGGPRDLSAANVIWSVGAILMALFSLVRAAPKATVVNVRSIAATAGMMMIPSMARWAPPSTGLTHATGLTLEIAGVGFTQLARVYLGRSFGLLPANRGIVCRGPFRLMRHPVYAGWLLMTLGYAICYPSALNMLINFVILPFLMWRIEQEEDVLMGDADYRAYSERTRWRLIPGLL